MKLIFLLTDGNYFMNRFIQLRCLKISMRIIVSVFTYQINLGSVEIIKENLQGSAYLNSQLRIIFRCLNNIEKVVIDFLRNQKLNIY